MAALFQSNQNIKSPKSKLTFALAWADIAILTSSMDIVRISPSILTSPALDESSSTLILKSNNECFHLYNLI